MIAAAVVKFCEGWENFTPYSDIELKLLNALDFYIIASLEAIKRHPVFRYKASIIKCFDPLGLLGLCIS